MSFFFSTVFCGNHRSGGREFNFETLISSAAFVSGDMLGAFDNCQITSVAEAMKAGGICAKSIATHLDLQVDMTLRPEFHQVQVSGCSFSGALRQGGKDGPFGFNMVIRCIFHLLYEAWIAPQCDFGVDVDGFRITHIGWSGNILLVARNRVQLERMIKATTAAFFARGMRWKAGELFFMQINGSGTFAHDDCISFSDEVEKLTLPE